MNTLLPNLRLDLHHIEKVISSCHNMMDKVLVTQEWHQLRKSYMEEGLGTKRDSSIMTFFLGGGGGGVQHGS